MLLPHPTWVPHPCLHALRGTHARRWAQIQKINLGGSLAPVNNEALDLLFGIPLHIDSHILVARKLVVALRLYVVQRKPIAASSGHWKPLI